MPYITLADIAKRANKSVATVSRVLNGKENEGIRISKKTRDQILSLSKELNYHPNYLARHLVKKDSRVIGLIIPDIMQIFFNEICYHMSRLLDKRNYDLLLAHSYEDPEPERKAIEMILARRVNGIVVAPAMGQGNLELLENIQNRKIPLVLLDRYFIGKKFHTVTSDDVRGSYLLVDHLVKKGARNIIFICGNKKTSVSLERIEGYRRAFNDNGLAVQEDHLLESGYFQNDGYEITRRLMAENKLKRTEAIMGVNDEVALGAMLALWEKEIDVPNDILIAGYGDERYSKYFKVPLTSVQQPTSELAGETCTMLMKLIQGKKITKTSVKIPCQLIVRESTGGES
jgi:LacI family transcriptional regulator